MGMMDYHKCLACRKGWVNEKTARRRFDWAKVMLKRYPEKFDWHNVRFSDEVHFGWGPQGKLSIIRQPTKENVRTVYSKQKNQILEM